MKSTSAHIGMIGFALATTCFALAYIGEKQKNEKEKEKPTPAAVIQPRIEIQPLQPCVEELYFLPPICDTDMDCTVKFGEEGFLSQEKVTRTGTHTNTEVTSL